MEIFEIKTEKQTNGLWGTPSSVLELHFDSFIQSYENNLIFSAILMGLAEKGADEIKCFLINENGLFISYVLGCKKYAHGIRFSSFKVEGNKLIHYN